MREIAQREESRVLGEALGVPSECCVVFSREPLGEGTVVGLEVREPEGAQPLFYYLDTSGLPVAAETGLRLGDLERPEARIWLHPSDPHVPALAVAGFPHTIATLLARVGIASAGESELVAYRPGRRAVLRVTTQTGETWIKVVRPSRVERIVEAQAALAGAGVPVPEVLSWSPEGLIVFAAAEGEPATAARWEPEQLLDRVDALRERLRGARLSRPVRGIAERRDWYLARAPRTPEAQALVERLRCAPLPAATAAGVEPVAVHGDLHLGQLFLDERGEVSAVIDADTAGWGAPAEDAAAFLSHAVASALLTPSEGAGRLWELADAASERWREEPGVRPAVSLHLLGHAVAASDEGDAWRASELLRCASAVLAGLSPSAGRTPQA